MDHSDHINLIKRAISNHDTTWADFGSGDGAFTLALRDIAGADVEIYSIDKDKHRLEIQKHIFEKEFPESHIHFIHADFTKELELPKLDGIIMANSLHYIRDQVSFLTDVKRYLKPKGKLVVVEYNFDTPNIWVPFPLSFETFNKRIVEAGYTDVQLLHTVALEWGREMYSAMGVL